MAVAKNAKKTARKTPTAKLKDEVASLKAELAQRNSQLERSTADFARQATELATAKSEAERWKTQSSGNFNDLAAQKRVNDELTKKNTEQSATITRMHTERRVANRAFLAMAKEIAGG